MIQRGIVSDLVRDSIQDLLRGSMARMSGDKNAKPAAAPSPFKTLIQAPMNPI